MQKLVWRYQESHFGHLKLIRFLVKSPHFCRYLQVERPHEPGMKLTRALRGGAAGAGLVSLRGVFTRSNFNFF